MTKAKLTIAKSTCRPVKGCMCQHTRSHGKLSDNKQQKVKLELSKIGYEKGF